MPPVDRRTFLATCASALVATGCTTAQPPDPQPTAGPDDDVRDAVAQSERALLASYDEALAAHPDLADDLAPLRAQHEAHLAGIGRTQAPASPASATAAALPRTSDAVLAALASAERRAQRQRSRACEAARDAALVRTLALVAASEAQHAEVLDGLAGTQDRR